VSCSLEGGSDRARPRGRHRQSSDPPLGARSADLACRSTPATCRTRDWVVWADVLEDVPHAVGGVDGHWPPAASTRSSTSSTCYSALSTVVSLFGMVNALALSVFERTRELGMLRAIGLTRRQTRRMVRYESVITALIGAALGLPLGIFLAAVTVGRCTSSMSRPRFPWPRSSRCPSSPSSPAPWPRSCRPGGPHARTCWRRSSTGDQPRVRRPRRPTTWEVRGSASATRGE
jgi:hypothetical protein